MANIKALALIAVALSMVLITGCTGAVSTINPATVSPAPTVTPSPTPAPTAINITISSPTPAPTPVGEQVKLHGIFTSTRYHPVSVHVQYVINGTTNSNFINANVGDDGRYEIIVTANQPFILAYKFNYREGTGGTVTVNAAIENENGSTRVFNIGQDTELNINL